MKVNFYLVTESFPVHIICASSMLLGVCVASSLQAKSDHFCMVSAFSANLRRVVMPAGTQAEVLHFQCCLLPDSLG